MDLENVIIYLNQKLTRFEGAHGAPEKLILWKFFSEVNTWWRVSEV